MRIPDSDIGPEAQSKIDRGFGAVQVMEGTCSLFDEAFLAKEGSSCLCLEEYLSLIHISEPTRPY